MDEGSWISESFDEAIDPNPQVTDLINAARSDGSIFVYNSNFNPIAKINFKGLFPTGFNTSSI